MSGRDPENRRASIAARLATLSSGKRALLEARLNSEERTAELAGLKPLSSEGPALLSFSQQRLWFLEDLGTADGTYNVVRSWWLEGPLKTDRLAKAFQTMVARQQSFRTEFLMLEDQPRQRIVAEVEFELPHIDLRSEPAAARRDKALGIAGEQATATFDLGKAPLLRASLVQVENESHLLVVVMHHIISDAWSMSVFARELKALYAGDEASLPELSIHYADYAAWQRSSAQANKLQSQLDYWRTQLAELPNLELPTDHPRPPTLSHLGATHHFWLPTELSDDLAELCRQSNVTLYMLLLAVFQVLLARYSRQDSFAVGSAIAGRTLPELEGLIGFFVNTLVLRADTSGDPGFGALLDRVRETALGAYSNQDVPYEKLVEELNPDRDLSRSPLIQVMFALQNVPGLQIELSGINVRREDPTTGTSKFDLTLMLHEKEEGLLADLEYATELFDAATIVRLGEHYVHLLEAVVRDPDCRISRLPLLSEAEQQRLLVDWNQTATDYPRELCVHALFERQAAATPAATALVHAGTALSYAELNARANRLAHRLVGLGVAADTLVGVCLERSVEMVVSLLAVLKAGGAYVPLDPGYPARRLASMLEDAAPAVLLTQRSLVAVLPAYAGTTLCVDEFDFMAGDHSPENLGREVAADHLAYVIYTSGSTGRPKGTCIEHRSIVRLVMDTDYVDLRPTDVVAQVSSCSFDAATFEVWGALLNGAQLVVIDKEVALAPALLAEALEQYAMTTMFVTTALFNTLAEVAPATLGRLRYLLFGGEAVTPGWVRQLLLQAPPEHLLHVYGPTETTTFATWHRVTQVAADAKTVPIGRPLANTTAYVLDPHRQPVPIGVPGELYIGGDGLARGYLHQAELTAASFVDNPFGAGRLYRTGDTVRYQPDGNLQFVGRVDHQVKLRGYRIELGEIEAALLAHPAVREAVVLLREDTPGNRRLTGYVATAAEATEFREALYAQLKAQLPDYMIPAEIMTLPALPLTPNGKLDRQALPAPGRDDALVQADYVAPRTPLEQTLSTIWQELLGCEQVGIHDSFFDLGGHSLLMTQLQSRLRDVQGINISMRALFESATIAKLAHDIEAVHGDSSDVDPNGREEGVL